MTAPSRPPRILRAHQLAELPGVHRGARSFFHVRKLATEAMETHG